MNSIRYCLLASGALSMSGCALLTNIDNLAPIPSQREFAPFSGRLLVPDGPYPRLSEFKIALVDFIGEYHGYAATRRKLEWDSTGMTSYGGLAAVLGGLADKTGLLNTGALVAGLGLATTSRYQFSQQAQVYFTAVKKLSCINSKVESVPDTVIYDAQKSDDTNAATIAQGAMLQLIGAVDAVRIEASNGMLGITPSVPTRDELLTMLKSYLQSKVVAAPNPDPNAQRYRDAGEQVKTVLSEVSSCVKS